MNYIIAAGIASGNELSITPNTLGCLCKTPWDFKKACLNGYRERYVQIDFEVHAKWFIWVIWPNSDSGDSVQIVDPQKKKKY